MPTVGQSKPASPLANTKAGGKSAAFNDANTKAGGKSAAFNDANAEAGSKSAAFNDRVALRGDSVGHLVRVRCTYCHDGLERDGVVYCASCLAPHHPGCHVEHGRCAGPGCTETRAVRPESRRSPWRRRALTALRVSVLLLAFGAGFVVLRAPPASQSAIAAPQVEPATPATQTEPAPEPAPEEADPEVDREPAPPTRRRVGTVRLSAEGLRLVTRGFRYHVVLERDERLVVELDDGFVRVHLVPAPQLPAWHRARTIMVAEPGDSIELRDGESTYTLRPQPGEPLVVEPLFDGTCKSPAGQVSVGPLRTD